MPAAFTVRPYENDDAASWLRCRALSFLGTQYYDDVRQQRPDLEEPALAWVAVTTGDPSTVVGILDIEIEERLATIDTVATHPDFQGAGIANALLAAVVPQLTEAGVSTLDAWTREDAAANTWYLRNGFAETFRYLHVYLGDGDDATGFATPEGLSSPVAAFMHGRLEDEAELRARFARVYTCRRYELAL